MKNNGFLSKPLRIGDMKRGKKWHFDYTDFGPDISAGPSLNGLFDLNCELKILFDDFENRRASWNGMSSNDEALILQELERFNGTR